MAKLSKKVTFSGEFFQELAARANLSVPEVGQKIELSKQTLYENIRENSISRDYLVKIAKLFSLERKDYELLMGKKSLSVFFRRERREEVKEEAKDKIRTLTNILIKIFELPKAKKNLPVFVDLAPNELAKEIRDTLELSNQKIPLEELMETLKKFGVFTFFYPFSYLGLNDDVSNKKKLRAASVPVGKNWVIFLDTSNTSIDSLYDLIHELAHIFSGHKLDSGHDEKLEEYCNNVASEVLTPSFFFKKNKEHLKKMFSVASPRIVGEAEKIQLYLGCSFEGLILALSSNEVINANVKRYLYACNNNKNKNSVKLEKYYYPDEGQSLASFWHCSLNNSSLSQYYEYFLIFKSAYLEGRATTRVLADAFSLDISNADTLCKEWIAENEFSEEEINHFKEDSWENF